MPRRGPALPLRDDGASRFLPWIVALMVYLAALALAAALVLDATVGHWQSGRSDTLTVQVPPAEGQATDDRVAAALEVLRHTPGVVAARALERAELVALLEPWLGKGNIGTDLPLPWLIDVSLAADAVLDSRALEARLTAAVPGAEIDDHGVWLGRLAAAARSIQAVALAGVLAIFAAAVGTVVFTTRTSLAVHHEVVEVLHLIGAHDAFVAGAFARQALRTGLRGGVLGLALAAITLALVGHFGAGVEAPLVPRLSLSLAGLGALAALPLASALIAMVTARMTVLRALARMP